VPAPTAAERAPQHGGPQPDPAPAMKVQA